MQYIKFTLLAFHFDLKQIRLPQFQIISKQKLTSHLPQEIPLYISAKPLLIC